MSSFSMRPDMEASRRKINLSRLPTAWASIPRPWGLVPPADVGLRTESLANPSVPGGMGIAGIEGDE
jgi:hypothetical protein